jgi:hypothetical protein
MCVVETVNGREYKVRDMAMADFGCVSIAPSPPPRGVLGTGV